MTDKEVKHIRSVLKACSKLKQVRVAMQVFSSLEEYVIPKSVYEGLLRVCLECDDLEQASIVMKQAEKVVSIDTKLKDRYLELFTTLKTDDHCISSDMRPDVPEFVSKFSRETFNPNA